MSRKTFLNILENVFAPSVNQAMRLDLLGAEKETTTLAAETTVNMDFTKSKFHELQLNTENITLNAVVAADKDSLKAGELVFFKIIQDNAAARTVTWGSNIINAAALAVTASADAVDVFWGIFDGTSLIIGALAQDVS